MARSDVQFSSAGLPCAAWLYQPPLPAPLPLVVMAHGFSGTREARLDAYAERFCAAGLGVLLFDYRHFGASAGEPRQLLDIAKQQADYRAAIAFARTLDWVDPDRIALFGTSFSAGHVIAIAAGDPAIAAVVCQCPFTDGLASLRAASPANVLKGTLAGLRDKLGSLVGAAPYYMPAVGPPGTFAAMTSADAYAGFHALLPERTLWQNRVAARISLQLARYRPGRRAKRLACPTLFCVCDRDALTPAAPTLRYAKACPRAEIRRYALGHFEIYRGEAFERAVEDQTEFLLRHLVAAAGAGELAS